MVHLLHRLYGVDAPAVIHAMRPKMLVANEIAFSSNFSFFVKNYSRPTSLFFLISTLHVLPSAHGLGFLKHFLWDGTLKIPRETTS